jgi:hypothetical protein
MNNNSINGIMNSDLLFILIFRMDLKSFMGPVVCEPNLTLILIPYSARYECNKMIMGLGSVLGRYWKRRNESHFAMLWLKGRKVFDEVLTFLKITLQPALVSKNSRVIAFYFSFQSIQKRTLLSMEFVLGSNIR